MWKYRSQTVISVIDVKILEGSREFLVPGSAKFAITREKALQLFGNENPIGKTINNETIEICAVVSGISKQSNYAFDLIGSFRAQSVDPNQMWNVSYGENAIIELLPGTNIEAFEKKLYEYEVNTLGMQNLTPQSGRSGRGISSWDDKPVDAEGISFEIMDVSPEYIAFYNFQLLAGEMLTAADPDSLVLLNESAVKAFGWHDAVGKRFDDFTVKGVIKDIYNFAPTVQPKPIYYQKRSHRSGGSMVLFKYQEGTWKSCKEKIEQMIKKDFPEEARYKQILNAEEEYNKFLKSEDALIKLLSFVSAICILICVFGFVSLVSLTCEERHKSIAIHKINGATTGNIIAIFAKEYALLLIVGAAFAFSTGFFIMHRWLEQYVKQTGIPVWAYLSILFIMAMVIVLCIGWQVYKASIANPAETIKNS